MAIGLLPVVLFLGVLVVGTLIAACAMTLLTFATAPFLGWPVAGVLLFVAVILTGFYTVRATNDSGAATSRAATLKVKQPL